MLRNLGIFLIIAAFISYIGFCMYRINLGTKQTYTADSMGVVTYKEYIPSHTDTTYIMAGDVPVAQTTDYPEEYLVQIKVKTLKESFMLDSKIIYKKFNVGSDVPVSLYTTESNQLVCKEFIKGY